MQDNPFRTSFAEEIFHRRYAQGPNDSWAALSERVVEDVCGTRWGTEPFPLLSREERNQLVQYIQQMKFIPGGRYLYYAGRPAHFYNNCFGGETKFLSKEGFQKLRDCVNKPVEILSPVDGKWKKARVESFGKQQLQEITFIKVFRGGSEVEFKVRATRTHHWPLIDGSDTYDLRVGDVVPANHYGPNSDLEDVQGFIVINIVPDREEEVFCVVEPEYNRFVLENNIDTFNCFALKAESDTREEWGNLCKRASDCLMSGGGIGVDYSIIREKGRILSRTGGVASGPIPLMNSINEIGRNVMQGGCLDADTLVTLSDGTHKKISQIRAGDIVATRFGPKRVSGFFDQGKKQTVRFDTAYGEVTCTEDHKWLGALSGRSKGWFKAHSFRPGHKLFLCSRSENGPREIPVVIESISLGGERHVFDLEIEDVHEFVANGFVSHNSRRSAIMATLNWQHPDSKEFVHLKDWPQEIIDLKTKDWNFPAPLDMTNISIGWDDDLLDLTMQGEVPDIWYESVKQMLMTGEPGHLYNFSPKADSTTRNAPVSRDTWVMTDKGYRRVADIWGVPQTIWTGQNWAKDVVFKMTKPRVNTVKVCMTGDRFIKADPTHEFFVERYKGAGKHRRLDRIERVPAEDLQVGDILHVSLPREDEVKPLNECAYTSIKVTAIEEGDEEPVFCCDVKLPEHSFCAEDVIISNCGEIDSEDDSDVCNLGSVNISRIESLDEFKDVCRLGAKFLICGALRGELPYPKVYEVRKRNMRIGLGLMGIHEFLLRHNQPYGVTPELGEYLSAYMEYSEKGANEHCDRFYCPRPLAYRAIAPNGTTGILASTTGGIEPLMAVAYKRRFLKDGTKWKSTYVVDATAQYLVDCIGVDPEAIETAFCLAEDPERRIKFQAQVQQYVDHCISSTINLPAWGTQHNNEDKVDDFANMLLEYTPHLRGITCYPDGSRGGQPIVPTPYKEAIEKQGFIFDEMEEKCAGGVCGL